MMPALRTMVIGCVDPRVDPAQVLGLTDGDALVIRNIGGRWTPGALQTMAALRAIAEAEGGAPGAGWNLILLQHTDCGITRLGGRPDLVAGTFGIDAADLRGKAVTIPAPPSPSTSPRSRPTRSCPPISSCPASSTTYGPG